MQYQNVDPMYSPREHNDRIMLWRVGAAPFEHPVCQSDSLPTMRPNCQKLGNVVVNSYIYDDYPYDEEEPRWRSRSPLFLPSDDYAYQELPSAQEYERRFHRLQYKDGRPCPVYRHQLEEDSKKGPLLTTRGAPFSRDAHYPRDARYPRDEYFPGDKHFSRDARNAPFPRDLPLQRDVPFRRDDQIQRDDPFLRADSSLRHDPVLRDASFSRDSSFLKDVVSTRAAPLPRDAMFPRELPLLRDLPSGSTAMSLSAQKQHWTAPVIPLQKPQIDELANLTGRSTTSGAAKRKLYKERMKQKMRQTRNGNVDDAVSFFKKEEASKKDILSNIEVKARIEDITDFLIKARIITEEPEMVMKQVDTYFNVKGGQLKLRQTEGESSQLIFYNRPEIEGPKLSIYHKQSFAHAAEVDGLKNVLGASFGVVGVVRKQRYLFAVGQTRISVDNVENLGHFMKLEVVLKAEQTAQFGEEIATELLLKLEIPETNLVSSSYITMVVESKNAL